MQERRSASPQNGVLIGSLGVFVVLAIIVVDWMTPPGVVVGIFLTIPIIATALLEDRRAIWVVAGVALVGYVLQLTFGAGPISPASVWVPNRIFVFLSLPAATGLALILHRLRFSAIAARDRARSESELNKLLMSLLAHDLRTPLTLAVEGLDYIMDSSAAGQPHDAELVTQLRRRLQRSLHSVEVVLSVAGGRTGIGDALARIPLSSLPADLAAEIEALSDEAGEHRKALELRLDGLRTRSELVDATVLKQGLTILLDNAIRHAVPGSIVVSASAQPDFLIVRVRDQGPGLSVTKSAPAERRRGSGIGLELLAALLAGAGGRLVVEQDGADGTCLAMCLPFQREPAVDRPTER